MLVILAHDRRRVVHVAVTAHLTTAWTAQQLREAFPGDQAPRYLLHDRDSAFAALGATAGGMGIRELRTAPQSPWQNAYAERVIGSIRRECLDHVIVMTEAGLRRIVAQYLAYYHHSRTHLALNKDAPVSRPITERATRATTHPERALVADPLDDITPLTRRLRSRYLVATDEVVGGTAFTARLARRNAAPYVSYETGSSE